MKSLKKIIDFLKDKKLKILEDTEFHTNIEYDFKSEQVRNLLVTIGKTHPTFAGLKTSLSG